MGKHLRNEKPTRPNTLLDIGAKDVPEGVELAVVVRLEDTAYNVAKIFEVDQLDFILRGLQLALETARYKQEPVPQSKKANPPPSEPGNGPAPTNVPGPPGPPLPPQMQQALQQPPNARSS